MSDAIVTERLTKFYGSQCVINNLNLRVPVGSVYGFLGRNGAGKSTTIRMLLGISRPNYGRAALLGCDANDLKPEVRSRIAFLGEGHPLIGWMSVAEAIEFHRAFHRGRWNQRLVDEILEYFELPMRRKVRRLSYGMRAQVALALALAPDPDLLILDDPTTGLDIVARRDFLISLMQFIRREGRTIFFSSHIISDVQRVADRVGILIDGVMRVDCPTAQFMERVRKVVLHFPDQPPNFPGCEGLVGVHADGCRLELIIVNFADSQRKIVESLSPAGWEVVEMNLEDACVEYTRGPKRLFRASVADSGATS